ncbi:MAG: molybdopterin-dependent oxidoreductase [Alphaproteobacteria bacterium]|nr:molybdopterin-dependent oxidoreductase [Alphaproteobacteria bacterium]
MYIGKALKRREDGRFLRGRGSFVDDVTLPDTAHAAYVRSPHAHAVIRGFATARARAVPGVLAVLTAWDWRDQGLGRSPCLWLQPQRDGTPMRPILRPILTDDRVRHVGDTVALVVAESRETARDAAELVEVEYEPLAANVEVARALAADAPVLHPDHGSNLAFDWDVGDAAATEAAFARAAHVVRLEIGSNRLAPSAMEPRAVLGHYDDATERYTLWTSTQNPHMVRRWLAEDSLMVPEQKVRVVSPDVGGGFGQKVYHYPEEPTVLWASKIVGRPVRWTAGRSETFVVDTHARDHAAAGELALDGDGTILAVRADVLANMGAYLSPAATCIPPYGVTLLPGIYALGAAYGRVRGVYTNTTPVDAYRGAGRPEALAIIERLIENGAKELGIDPCELRRRNLIRAEQFPYTTPTDLTYDSGDPPQLMQKLVDISNYQGLRAEQRRLRAQGTLMGIGLAAFMDGAGFGPSKMLAEMGAVRWGGWDSATIRVHPSGKVTALCGSHNHGQGHATTFAQVLADKLGRPIEDIEIVEGDSDRIPYGTGTYASRSMTVSGAALAIGAERLIEKASVLAAHLLETATNDVEYDAAGECFVVKGTDRRIGFAALTEAAYSGADYPEGFELGLEETVFYDPPDFNFPSAAHLCVVLVDPETGGVKLRDYNAVDDVGVVINPMVIEGQIHGGLAQGGGQALLESCAYDAASGQLLAGTFMDYAMPRAADLPSFVLDKQETPAPNHPLGVKGAGESGTIGAPAAIANAVVDALWHLGVRHIEMPLTPARVLAAIAAAGH